MSLSRSVRGGFFKPVSKKPRIRLETQKQVCVRPRLRSENQKKKQRIPKSKKSSYLCDLLRDPNDACAFSDIDLFSRPRSPHRTLSIDRSSFFYRHRSY